MQKQDCLEHSGREKGKGEGDGGKYDQITLYECMKV
jgi:hypothetical protein